MIAEEVELSRASLRSFEDIPECDVPVLYLVAYQGELGHKQLSDTLGRHHTPVQHTIDRLADRDFVERNDGTPDPKPHHNHVKLTAEGLGFLHRHMPFSAAAREAVEREQANRRSRLGDRSASLARNTLRRNRGHGDETTH